MTAPSPRGVALFFGPHPDDIELFAGGTAARLARLGHRVVLCDLSSGECATNGDPATRAREAETARALLGASERVCLGLPDLRLNSRAAEQVDAVAALIRSARPDVVFCPAAAARHPDHSEASALVRRAVFVAGVGGAALEGDAHRTKQVLRYVCRVTVQPSILVQLDAADVDAKFAAIAAHTSQVGSEAHNTLVGDASFPAALRARDAYWGAHAGVAAAEPFVSDRLPVVEDPIDAALASGGPVHWFLEVDA